jgi:hypothetical protein
VGCFSPGAPSPAEQLSLGNLVTAGFQLLSGDAQGLYNLGSQVVAAAPTVLNSFGTTVINVGSPVGDYDTTFYLY